MERQPEIPKGRETKTNTEIVGRFEREGLFKYKGEDLGILKQKVTMFLEWCESAGIEEGIIRQRLPEEINNIAETYFDSRSAIPNKKFLIKQLNNDIESIYPRGESSPDVSERASRVALFNFDLNGLKSVNDILGHSRGDYYLSSTAFVLNHGNLTGELRHKGYQVTAYACGGDEYSIRMESPEPLTDDFLHRMLTTYQQELQSFPVFFEDDQKKIKDLFIKEIPEIKIPENFEFYPTMGGGFSTLADVYRAYEESDHSKTPRSDTFNARLERVWYDTADIRATTNKETFKRGLKEGEDATDVSKFLSLILLRNAESRILQQSSQSDLEKMHTEIERLKRELKDAHKELWVAAGGRGE